MLAQPFPDPRLERADGTDAMRENAGMKTKSVGTAVGRLTPDV
jgi:hypothetical protein